MHKAFSFRVLIYLFILIILDLSLVPVFRLGGARPILIYLIVPYAAFQWHRSDTTVIAILAGLIRDSLSTGLFGLETISVVLASMLFDLVSHKVNRESLLVRCGLTFAFILCYGIIFLILSGLFGFQIPWTWYTLGVSFGTAFYTMIFVPVFFFFSARWFHDRVPFKQYELFK